MKVIFAGPTLHGANVSLDAGCQFRPPARQGDFYDAIKDGANVIGLIDGNYEYVPAIWHKEILFGLSHGVQILGAASMGALRAAECAAFGMVGVGEIYRDFAGGLLEDDSDVAQAHGPAETNFLPLSEPLVNVRATISRCLQLTEITDGEADQLHDAARRIFFKDRTYRHLAKSAIQHPDRAREILASLRRNTINLKLNDAMTLIATVMAIPDRRFAADFDWRFEATDLWRSAFSGF
jgi:hypothetical protein